MAEDAVEMSRKNLYENVFRETQYTAGAGHRCAVAVRRLVHI